MDNLEQEMSKIDAHQLLSKLTRSSETLFVEAFTLFLSQRKSCWDLEITTIVSFVWIKAWITVAHQHLWWIQETFCAYLVERSTLSYWKVSFKKKIISFLFLTLTRNFFVLSENKELLVCGDNHKGALGIGETHTNQGKPEILTTGVDKIFCGYAHSLILKGIINFNSNLIIIFWMI